MMRPSVEGVLHWAVHNSKTKCMQRTCWNGLPIKTKMNICSDKYSYYGIVMLLFFFIMLLWVKSQNKRHCPTATEFCLLHLFVLFALLCDILLHFYWQNNNSSKAKFHALYCFYTTASLPKMRKNDARRLHWSRNFCSIISQLLAC